MKSIQSSGSVYQPANEIFCREGFYEGEDMHSVPEHLRGSLSASITLRSTETTKPGDTIDADIVLYTGGSYLTDGAIKVRFGVSTKVNSKKEVRHFYDIAVGVGLPLPDRLWSAKEIGKLSYFSILT